MSNPHANGNRMQHAAARPYQERHRHANVFNSDNQCAACDTPLNECLTHNDPNCKVCQPAYGDYHWECWLDEICPVCHSPSDTCPDMWHHVCPECRAEADAAGDDREIFLESHPENDAKVYMGCEKHNYYPTPVGSMDTNNE